MSKFYDVIVIGAGYTGLSAALDLQEKGVSFILLEASDRVGGRTFDYVTEKGFRLELGGQYIAPIQNRVTKMVSQMGLKTFEAWGKGDHFLLYNNELALYQSTPAECLAKLLKNKEIQKEIENAIELLDQMQQQVPKEAPWNAPKADIWDAITFRTWIENHLTADAAKEFFRLMTNQGFSTEPEQISLLQMLWFFQTSHGLPPWAMGGAQANRVEGGTGLLAIKMAETLKSPIQYEERVHTIIQNENGVKVLTDKETFLASHVIVAIPPQLIPSIHYEPILPPDLHRAFSSFQSGNSMKIQAVYKTPFWRQKGLSGNGISFNKIPAFTYDNSPSDGDFGVLLGFITAKEATTLNNWSKEKRMEAILATWKTVFGPEIANPIEYIEHDWLQEPHIRGGHGSHFPPGVWKELGPALGQNKMPHFGHITWAASDLAKDWNGYLEGAIYAGNQAVMESL